MTVRGLARGAVVAAAAFVSGGLAVHLAGPGGGTGAAPPPPPHVAGSDIRRTPVVEVVERESTAVVNVSTDTIVSSSPFAGRGGFGDLFGSFFRDFRPKRRMVPNSLGSGVIVHPDGYVLTNYHVLIRANRVRVTTADGTEYEAEGVGADPQNDLAVLKIQGKGPFPAVPMGTSSDLMIGETVIAIGNPFGLSHTVTTGVVSATNRSVPSQDGTEYTDFIQTDASINPGNSGGPLLNIEGELIGINTAIRPGAEGIGFAIPVDRARRVLGDLIQYGAVRPAWLGMEVWDLTPDLAAQLGVKPGGVVVRRVLDGSPAAAAGVAAGDRVLDLEGSRVENRSAWLTLLSHHGPGDSLRLDLDRGGRKVGVTVAMQALDRDRALSLAKLRLGLVLDVPSSRERAMGYPPDVLVIRQVSSGSPADRVGLEPGDVVTHLQGERVRDLDEFADVFSRVWERRVVLLFVSRRGNLYRVPLEMD